MNVHVDEARSDVAAGQIDARLIRTDRPRPRRELGDPARFDDERLPRHDAVRQDETRARQECSHRQSDVTSTLRPRSGSGVRPRAQHASRSMWRSNRTSAARRRAEQTITPGLSIRRKPAVVEEVVVERDDRPAELARAAKVLDVAGAAQIVVLEDEEHVPAQIVPHERHDAGRHVGIDVHTRRLREIGGDWQELGCQRAHDQHDVSSASGFRLALRALAP